MTLLQNLLRLGGGALAANDMPKPGSKTIDIEMRVLSRDRTRTPEV